MTLKSDAKFEEKLTCSLKNDIRQVLESIHKFIIELHVLQFLYKGGRIKNKGGVGLFQITQKRDFFICYINQVLLGIISRCGAPSCTLRKKSFVSLSVCASGQYIGKLNLKGEFTDLF